MAVASMILIPKEHHAIAMSMLAFVKWFLQSLTSHQNVSKEAFGPLQEQHSIIHHWLLPRFHLLQLCAKRNLGKEAQLISFH